jgi:hypothetical protein
MSFNQHISHVTKVGFMYLRAVSRQRHCLTKRGAQLLIEAYVISRLNFCISLLFSITCEEGKKLQRILHCSVRLVDQLGRSENVDAPLQEKGWLCIRKRITFRVAMLTYTALMNGTPRPLAALLNNKQESSHASMLTRSTTDSTLLLQHRTRTKMGDAAFRTYAVTVWNSIPRQIRESNTLSSFKVRLWNHLQNSA